MDEMEDDVLKFAKEVEARYSARCSLTLDDCSKNNYDNCNTEFPYMSCPNILPMDDCSGCYGLYDYTVSNVRLAKSIKVDF